MIANQILMVGRDPTFVQWVRSEIDPLDRVELRVTSNLEDARLVARQMPFGLILVHLDSALDRGRLARMIAEGAEQRRPVPVVALSESYHEAEAASLFRGGLADYLSRADHQGRIARVAEALLGVDSASTRASKDRDGTPVETPGNGLLGVG